MFRPNGSSRAFRFACASAAAAMLGLSSCAPDDFSQPIPDEPITAQEIVAGVGDPGFDHSEPTEGIDGPPAVLASLAPQLANIPNETDENATSRASEDSACRAATGYRSGAAITICVTSVDGKLVEIRTATAYRRMQAAARAAGIAIAINSGFRTMQRQRELYACYRAGNCPLAARPGYSNHQSGLALDLNTSARGVYRWLTAHARTYGFVRTVPSEIWHWEHR